MNHTFVTLQHYLNNHKYGNAEADDLWAALSQVSCLSWHAIFRRVPKMANFSHAKVGPLENLQNRPFSWLNFGRLRKIGNTCRILA